MIISDDTDTDAQSWGYIERYAAHYGTIIDYAHAPSIHRWTVGIGMMTGPGVWAERNAGHRHDVRPTINAQHGEFTLTAPLDTPPEEFARAWDALTKGVQ